MYTCARTHTHTHTHTAPLHQLRHTQLTPAPCLLSSCPGWVLATQTSPQSLSQPLVHSEQTRFVQIQAAGVAVNPGCKPPSWHLVFSPALSFGTGKRHHHPLPEQVPEPFTLQLSLSPLSFPSFPPLPSFSPSSALSSQSWGPASCVPGHGAGLQ